MRNALPWLTIAMKVTEGVFVLIECSKKLVIAGLFRQGREDYAILKSGLTVGELVQIQLHTGCLRASCSREEACFD